MNRRSRKSLFAVSLRGFALWLSLGMAVSPALAQGNARWVYHWVDARGIGHFSDTWVEGAKRVSASVQASRKSFLGAVRPQPVDSAAVVTHPELPAQESQ